MTPLPRDLARLLKSCATELGKLDADWAVAGAVAMAVHGYERATRDVDLLIADDAREPLLERLADRGIPVEDVFPPVHYAIAPQGSSHSEVGIDLLFPALGVETLALMAAQPMLVGKLRVPVIPLHHLVATKLLVDPGEDPERYARDLQDLRALRLRGLVDARRVEGVLADVGDRSALVRLRALMKSDRS